MEQEERKAVNKVLEDLIKKWNKKTKEWEAEIPIHSEISAAIMKGWVEGLEYGIRELRYALDYTLPTREPFSEDEIAWTNNLKDSALRMVKK